MPVDDSIRHIRDTFNKGIYLYNIKRHGLVWDMVAAAMDTIEDTQLAIESYSHKRNGDIGHQYLETYGLFQSIFLQQDALTNLAKGLNLDSVNIWKDEDAKYVRTIRDKYFGHPTEHKKGNKRGGNATYHGIARMSIGTGVLEGWTYPGFSLESINIDEVLKRHTKATKQILQSTQKDLEAKGKAYMATFTKKLPEAEHGYEFQKLYMWALGSRDDGIMAGASVEILSKELQEIKDGIGTRYDKAEQVGDVMREIAKAEYCLKIIKKGMDGGKTDTKSNFYYETHIDALEKTYEGVIDICKEINQQFAINPNQ
jgi:hypothetical protein